MPRYLSIKHSRISGFTLVEILIVVVVLGILAAFTVPKFKNVFTTTTSTQLLHNVNEVNLRLEQFENQGGTFGGAGTFAQGNATTAGKIDVSTAATIVDGLIQGVYANGCPIAVVGTSSGGQNSLGISSSNCSVENNRVKIN